MDIYISIYRLRKFNIYKYYIYLGITINITIYFDLTFIIKIIVIVIYSS